ncbi:MAG: cytochrome c biogenesis protein CcsA [Gammaproteobacteria bacterium]|nr:cytochrome c biogenesis protein CcsA [Gammaproteobacteria bacterium]
MTVAFLGISATALYLITTLILARRLFRKGAGGGRLLVIVLAGVAIALHAAALQHALFTPSGLNLGFFNAFSLFSLLIAALLVLAIISYPVESLGVAILPTAAFSALLGALFQDDHIVQGGTVPGLEVHIFTSVLAYGMLSIAAVQAILLFILDRRLRHKQPGGFVQALPPLQTMETLLFQMIALGFSLQSLSLISGAIFIEDMFAQHLVHKTVLSILAWLLFAILLYGRWKFGWRGRTAMRWTLSAFITLLVAYFGSKLVLEVVIGAQ